MNSTEPLVPALQDTPYEVAILKKLFEKLADEVALLQARVVALEPKKRMFEQYADQINEEILQEKKHELYDRRPLS
jgi:hypothetical protein